MIPARIPAIHPRMEEFSGLHPVAQALLAALFTWGVTALGAAMVFFFRELNRRVLDAMLGFTVMMVLDVALG